MEQFVVHLPDVDATLALGGRLGELLAEAGADAVRAVMLRGDLGSGKTTLTRGLVAALPGGEQAEVASPSFTIINLYATEPPVMHADLFRCPPGIGLPDELDEALDFSGTAGQAGQRMIVLVEWPEHLPDGIVPAERLDILLETCHASRRFSATAYGGAARGLCAALGGWLEQTHPEWLSTAEDCCHTKA